VSTALLLLFLRGLLIADAGLDVSCGLPDRRCFGQDKAIKEFFPQAQLFGFTGTPIFEENASRVKIEDQEASFQTTSELFQKQLHAYTITHAIEDANVLRFHVDFFKPEGKRLPKPGEPLAKKAVTLRSA
jgi:type I restriction enzyme R subunit